VWSAFHEPALLSLRVRRLVDGAAHAARSRRVPLAMALAPAALLFALGASGFPQHLHQTTELLLRLLP
jgi:hypothetical protein